MAMMCEYALVVILPALAASCMEGGKDHLRSFKGLLLLAESRIGKIDLGAAAKRIAAPRPVLEL